MIETPEKPSSDPRRFALKKHSTQALILLICAMVVMSVIQIWAVMLKERSDQIVYDEAVSYLAATGHEGAYARAKSGALNGRWVAASEWKDLMQPGRILGFRTIARDLSEADYHPPLYFWLLHIWVLIFGVHASSGLWLNWLFALATGYALFRLAREALGDELEAAAVAAVWLVAGPVTITNLVARHYALFGLVTTVFVWLVVRACDRERRLRWYDYVFFALATTAGALTHYHFALVLSGGALFALVRLVRRDLRRLLTMTGAAFAGGLLAFLLNPWFYDAFKREHEGQAVKLTKALVRLRFREVRPRLSVFFGSTEEWGMSLLRPVRPALRAAGGGALSAGVMLALLVALAAAALFALPRTRRPLVRYLRGVRTEGWWVLWFLVWIGGATIGLFLIGQSPKWALNSRYMAAVWPFLAFVPLFVARLAKRWAVVIVVVFCAVFMVPQNVQHMRTYLHVIPGDKAALQGADHIVFDTVTRGILLRMVWGVPDDTLVYVDRIDQLIASPDAWRSDLATGDVYASYAGTKELRARRKLVEDLILQFYRPLTSLGGVPGVVGTAVMVLGSDGLGPVPDEPAPGASPSPNPAPSASPSAAP
jgi:hypothetical protein